MIKNLLGIFSNNLPLLYDNHIRVKFKYLTLVFLFVGLSATFLISVSSATLVYSLSNLAYNNTAKTVLTNQSSTTSTSSSELDFKQISPKVTNFILNNVVNKSKAALVVGLIDPNGTKVYSFGNISKANDISVNGSTIFNIDSITKTFTTLVLADMIKQGIVHLDDPIENYLPSNVKVPQYNGTKITLENLATHTSGLPFMPSNIWINNTIGTINPNYNSTQLYQGLANTTLSSKPGTKFLYSDFGMGLLGHILSLKEKVPYEQLVKHRILDVLGMNDTKITLSQNDIKYRFPVGHQNGSEIQTPKIPSVIAGAGGLRSTANDLLKYLSANMGLLHTKLDDSIALQHLIQHSGLLPNPMNYSIYIALGWAVLTNLGTETLDHTGSINGWNANVAFIPTKKIGVVSLCSCDLKDMNTGTLDFVLLNLTGIDSLTAYHK
ncbi:MAG: serine hydrolase domain-containing protein [Candidatus Nitrosocosmicus sp.]